MQHSESIKDEGSAYDEFEVVAEDDEKLEVICDRVSLNHENAEVEDWSEAHQQEQHLVEQALNCYEN